MLQKKKENKKYKQNNNWYTLPLHLIRVYFKMSYTCNLMCYLLNILQIYYEPGLPKWKIVKIRATLGQADTYGIFPLTFISWSPSSPAYWMYGFQVGRDLPSASQSTTTMIINCNDSRDYVLLPTFSWNVYQSSCQQAPVGVGGDYSRCTKNNWLKDSQPDSLLSPKLLALARNPAPAAFILSQQEGVVVIPGHDKMGRK